MREIFLILVLQLIYVPLLALRTICMVKKLTVLTAFFGFLESFTYVFGLAIVLSGDQSMLGMLVYALGFSLGLVAGIYIENKIAIGYTSILVNIRQKNTALITRLRECGFGVTVFEGEGKDSPRFRLDILTKRARELELLALIDDYEPAAFVLAYEPTRFKGGFMEQMMKKQNRRRAEMKMEVSSAQNSSTEAAAAEEDSASWLRKKADGIVSEVKELAHYDTDPVE